MTSFLELYKYLPIIGNTINTLFEPMAKYIETTVIHERMLLLVPLLTNWFLRSGEQVKRVLRRVIDLRLLEKFFIAIGWFIRGFYVVIVRIAGFAWNLLLKLKTKPEYNKINDIFNVSSKVIEINKKKGNFEQAYNQAQHATRQVIAHNKQDDNNKFVL